MFLTSRCFQDNGWIPGECAFAVPHPENRFATSSNLNPDLEWGDLPAGTKSLVLICHDPDVPAVLDDFNKEGRTVAASIPRIDLYHWVLVDIDPAVGQIGKGEFSNGIVPHGKPGPAALRGTRQGLNDFTQWFRDDPNMAGSYFGYDGPCPPWNDEIAHRYFFTLYALDVAKCPVSGSFTAPNVLKAIEGHCLGTKTLVGRYSLNPEVLAAKT